MSVNISPDTSNVVIQSTANTVTVVDTANNVNVSTSQPITNVITVAIPGPQGAVGPVGPIANTGSFATTGSNTFNGNQTINGSLILDNGAVIKDNANNSISFGYQAAEINQGTQSVAIGNGAGNYNQSHGTVAIGASAGALDQGLRAIALGPLAGANAQRQDSIAIGTQAGGTNQGEYSVALGYWAGRTNQASHSIVINATGNDLDNTITSSLVIAPIRNTVGSDGVLQYNNTTKEVSYATTLNGITNLATTGSNIFSGSQEITGSVTIANTSSAWSFREDGVLKLNDGIAEIYADPDTYSLRIGTAPENVSPSTQIILGGGNQSFTIRTGSPLRQWEFSNINGDFNLTGSINGATNLATTGSVTFTGNQIVTGSTRGNVTALSITSNTASMNLSTGNFFTLQLVSGSNTFINPSNILPGQTSILTLSTTGSATVSFPSSVKQPSGSAYVPTTTVGVDILTFASVNTSSLYVVSVKNMI
jgi:hypothetical protein